MRTREELNPLIDEVFEVMKEYGVSLYCVEYVLEQVKEKFRCVEIK